MDSAWEVKVERVRCAGASSSSSYNVGSKSMT